MKYNTFVSLIKDLPITEKIASGPKTGEYIKQKPKQKGDFKSERKAKYIFRTSEF